MVRIQCRARPFNTGSPPRERDAQRFRTTRSYSDRNIAERSQFFHSCAVAKQHRKNKRPQLQARAKYCCRTEQEESHTRRPPRRRRQFDPKNVHPVSLRSSGLFVTLCALTDSKFCMSRREGGQQKAPAEAGASPKGKTHWPKFLGSPATSAKRS